MTYYSVQKFHDGEWINWYAPYLNLDQATQKMETLQRDGLPLQYSDCAWRVVPWSHTRQLQTSK